MDFLIRHYGPDHTAEDGRNQNRCAVGHFATSATVNLSRQDLTYDQSAGFRGDVVATVRVPLSSVYSITRYLDAGTTETTFFDGTSVRGGVWNLGTVWQNAVGGSAYGELDVMA